MRNTEGRGKNERGKKGESTQAREGSQKAKGGMK